MAQSIPPKARDRRPPTTSPTSSFLFTTPISIETLKHPLLWHNGFHVAAAQHLYQCLRGVTEQWQCITSTDGEPQERRVRGLVSQLSPISCALAHASANIPSRYYRLDCESSTSGPLRSPLANLAAYVPHPYHSVLVGGYLYYGDNGHPAHQAQRFAQDISRPSSRSSRRRSPSPNTARGRRSASASTNGKKGRSRSSKNRGSTVRSHTELYSDSITGYSRADEHGSTSGKNKEQQPTTDISVENIVKGGRRKRAKFETSVSGDRLVASKD